MQDKPGKPYDSDHLRMLSGVLNEALAAITTTSRGQVSSAQERIGKVIMDSFVAGETDPERLKAIALQSMRVQ